MQPSVQPVQPERDYQYVERFRAIADYVAGRLGVCAIDTGNGRTLGTNTNGRFAMASTFKWLLAAAVLKRHEAIPTILDQTRRVFEEKNLLDYAPVTRAAFDASTSVIAGKSVASLSLAELCSAAVSVSDNTAANLLLSHLGGAEGPAALTQFLRESGDTVTRLDRTEPTLNENAKGDPRDTTTPAEMAQTMARLLTTDEVLNAASRARLIGWMRASTTGWTACVRACLRSGMRATRPARAAMAHTTMWRSPSRRAAHPS
ncbi:MAG: hypothetical protein B7Z38_04215 [Rhodobacterales bacterium 12-64-8]|nr:MAG: hypothetical protein B7Z38_04215 [Rhodobacterales bacterium 12-64-8]